MHRMHQDGLTGNLLSKPRDIWNHVCLPMISEREQFINSILVREKELCSRKEDHLLYPLEREEFEIIK